MLHRMRGETRAVSTLFLAILLLVGFARVEAEAFSEDAVAELFAKLPDGVEPSLDQAKDFESILAIAIAADKGVRAAGYGIDAALAGLKQLGAGLRPQIQGSLDYEIENGTSFGTSAIGRWSDTFHTASGALTVAQQFGPNNTLQTALAKGKAGLEQVVIQRQQAVVNAIKNVQTAFYGFVKARKGTDLAEAAVDNARTKLEIAEQKVMAGTSSLVDLLKARTDLIEAENNLSKARSGLDLSLLALLEVIGLDESYLQDAYSWADGLIAAYDATPVEWKVDYEELVKYAEEHRLDVQLAAKEVEMAAADVSGVENRRDWKLTVSGTHVTNGYAFAGSVDSDRLLVATVVKSDSDGPEAGIPGVPSEVVDDPWQIKAGVTVTFGDGGARKAEMEQVKAKYQLAELKLQGALDAVSIEVFDAYQKMEQAWRAYEQVKLARDYAKATYKQVERLSGLGSVPASDLKEARLLLVKAQNDLLGAQLDYEASKTALAAAIGYPVEELLESVVNKKFRLPE